MWAWTLGEKIYWTADEPSSDRADCFSGVRLAPAPTTVWGTPSNGNKAGTAGPGAPARGCWPNELKAFPRSR